MNFRWWNRKSRLTLFVLSALLNGDSTPSTRCHRLSFGVWSGGPRQRGFNLVGGADLVLDFRVRYGDLVMDGEQVGRESGLTRIYRIWLMKFTKFLCVLQCFIGWKCLKIFGDWIIISEILDKNKTLKMKFSEKN